MPESLTDDDIFELAREGYEILGILPVVEHWYIEGNPARACLCGAAAFVHLHERLGVTEAIQEMGRSFTWFSGVSDGFAGVLSKPGTENDADYQAGRVLGERGRSQWVPSDLSKEVIKYLTPDNRRI